jgi:hypothetical protein
MYSDWLVKPLKMKNMRVTFTVAKPCINRSEIN